MSKSTSNQLSLPGILQNGENKPRVRKSNSTPKTQRIYWDPVDRIDVNYQKAMYLLKNHGRDLFSLKCNGGFEWELHTPEGIVKVTLPTEDEERLGVLLGGRVVNRTVSGPAFFDTQDDYDTYAIEQGHPDSLHMECWDKRHHFKSEEDERADIESMEATLAVAEHLTEATEVNGDDGNARITDGRLDQILDHITDQSMLLAQKDNALSTKEFELKEQGALLETVFSIVLDMEDRMDRMQNKLSMVKCKLRPDSNFMDMDDDDLPF